MDKFRFMSDTGGELLGIGKAEAAVPTAPTARSAEQLNQAAAQVTYRYIESMQLKMGCLNVAFDGVSETVTVAGAAPDQATHEKMVLCCGKATTVNQNKAMANPEPLSKCYTVIRGDNLPKIRNECHRTPNKYPQIFEANKSMRSLPDKTNPGQVLGLPAVRAL